VKTARNARETDIASVGDGVQCWSSVGVAVLDVWTDERYLRTTQHHDECIVVWSEQFNQQVRRAHGKRDLHLEVNSTANHHRRRVVVVAGLEQRERDVVDKRHRLRHTHSPRSNIVDINTDVINDDICYCGCCKFHPRHLLQTNKVYTKTITC